MNVNCFYLRAKTPLIECWETYQPGELLRTPRGKPRFFRTLAAAVAHRRALGLTGQLEIVKGDTLS